MEPANKRASVIGAGLVGSLAAAFFAQRGYQVDIYEKRADIRAEAMYEGRSINLALSERGIQALKRVGLADKVVAEGLPMSGRMLHLPDGALVEQPYGLHGETILSVDRRKLNETLLDAVEAIGKREQRVHLHFNHRLVDADLDAKSMTFAVGDSTVTATTDVILGTDGAYSNVRERLMKRTRMDYSQQYIGHSYKELTIYPSSSGDWRMSHKHLHIWPRHSFMMIALPNQDRTFTCTLFMPYEEFDSIKTPEDLQTFFERYFPDAIGLIGLDNLKRDYFKHPTGALMSVKCTPYNYKGNVIILGDAAHAMVPFYGQGMNAGFQDCQVLDDLLNECADNLEVAFARYTAQRRPDAEAICDLAVYNYLEMRSKVVSPWYQLQRQCAALLHHLAPSRFIPLYPMVAFTTIPYSRIMPLWQRQLRLINIGLSGAFGTLLVGAGVAAYQIARHKEALLAYFK